MVEERKEALDTKKKQNVKPMTIVLCVIFLIAAFVFGFVLQGYSCLAYACVYAAAFVAILGFAPDLARRIALIVTALLVVAVAITEVPIIRASQGTSDGTQKYLVVLGAKVNGTEPSKSLRYRLEGALAYLEANEDAICVASGGQGPDEGISEAECMSRWLQDRGIAATRIILESESTTTDENLSNSFDAILAFEGRGGESGYGQLEGNVAIASSSYHLFRVELKVGAYGFSAATVSCYPGQPLLAANYFLREAFAVWAQLLFG